MCLVLGKIRTFPQKNGEAVQLRIYGDEFYARYETMDGYTVVYDTDREEYCFAIQANGSLVSGGSPLYKPVPWGIVRHLQEDKAIRNQKFDRAYGAMRPTASPPPGVSATLGANNGLLPGTQLSREGRVRGLTILVNFKDVKTQIQPDQVEGLLNGDNFTAYGNACSVKTYYQIISSGRLDYTNEVIGPVTLSKNRAHYINTPCMTEALDLAVEGFGVRLADYDSRQRGVVDAINFLYAGETLYSGWLWPHNHTMSYDHRGMSTDLYTIQSLGRQPVDMKIGTFCHEAGHLICRFPDLYDYGKRDGDSDPSAGMGYFCLMSGGSHLNRGRSPAPVCGYLRHLAGWTGNEILIDTPGRYQARQGDYNTIHTYPVAGRPNEYFILENRSRMGLDSHCPANGLAVYHCDTQGSNEWQGGTADRHYQCALIQADGARNLENNRNQGDGADLFDTIRGLALSGDTLPSSRAWGGQDSGLELYNITRPGEAIFFEAGQPGPRGGDMTISKEARPSLLIPDNDPDGVNNFLTFSSPGTIKSIRVSLDITHPYSGDLKVRLIPPGTEAIVLADREGGAKDDFKAVFDSENLLARLKGHSFQGVWTLHVRDLAGQDVGRLNHWLIEIQYQPLRAKFREEKTENLAIPDKDPQGVSSVIHVAKKGLLKEVVVGFELDHSYHGDLSVTLCSPGGPEISLVGFNTLGNRKGLLEKRLSSLDDKALSSLAGTSIQGDWTLKVTDQWERDTGTLNKWFLELVYE